MSYQTQKGVPVDLVPLGTRISYTTYSEFSRMLMNAKAVPIGNPFFIDLGNWEWTINTKSITLYGVQVINRGLNSTTYEAVLLDDIDKTREEYTLRINFLDPYCRSEFVQIINFEFTSETCFVFTIPNYYDPSLYEFILMDE
jgi:hypothetical protein